MMGIGCMLTRQPPTTTTSRLRPVNRILRRDEEYRPQFRNSQNIPLSPSIPWVSIVMVLGSVGLTCEPTGKERRLRQLALFNSTHTIREPTIKLSKSLNTGIASAIIHARVHSTNPIITHVPIETSPRWCMRSVPRNKRT